jgi:hypothetical protein
MSDELLQALQQNQQMLIETQEASPTITREVPSVEQELQADEVFSEQQPGVFAAWMALQTGTLAVHLMVDNNRQLPEPDRNKPKPKHTSNDDSEPHD